MAAEAGGAVAGRIAPLAAHLTPTTAVTTAASSVSAYSGQFGGEFLHGHIRQLLAFYDPIVRDDALGGFHNQLRDDGSVYDSRTKHAVGTARFTTDALSAGVHDLTVRVTDTTGQYAEYSQQLLVNGLSLIHI